MAYSHDINLQNPGSAFNIDFGLTGIYTLVVQNSTQLQASEKITTLSAHYVLVTVNDTQQLSNSGNVSLKAIPDSTQRISTKVGSFNINTSKLDNEYQTIDGVGFQPKIVLFWWGGSTSTVDSVSGGDIRQGFGFGISSSKQGQIGYISEDAEGTTIGRGVATDEACIYIFLEGATPTVDGTMIFYSQDINGFTLKIGNQFTNPYRISYLAIGGEELTNVNTGQFTITISGGNHSITGVGFKPDAVILLAAQTTSIPLTTSTPNISIGIATASTEQNVVLNFSADNAGTTQTQRYNYNNEVVAMVATTGTYHRERFVSFDDDGFTLNHIEGLTTRYGLYIAFKGGYYKVDSINTRTDENDIVKTGLGFSPKSLLFLSHNTILSTEDTVQANARLSIGAAISPTERAVMATSDENGLAASETAYANYDSAVYAHITDDAIVGLMDIKSIDVDGFTTVMDDPDPSAARVVFLAIGGVGSADARLIVQNATQAQSSNNLDLVLIYNLLTDDSTQLQTVDNITLTAYEPSIVLIIQNTIQSQTSENINLSAHYSITIQDSTQIQTSENTILSAHYSIVPNNAIHLQTSDNVILTQHQVLQVNDSTHLQTSDNISLNQNYILIVNNSLQSQNSDKVNLIQHQVLQINNCSHIQNSENIILIQHHILVVNNSTQAQISDNVVLSAHYSITTNDCTQAQISDNVVLSAHYSITANNSTQAQTSNNVILSAHYSITTNNCTQTQTSDNVVLSAHYSLTTNSCNQIQTSDNVILSAHYSITANTCTQTQISNNVVLNAHYSIVTNNSSHVQSSENIILTQHQILAINDSIHLQTSDNIILTQHQILVVNNVTQNIASSNITLIYQGYYNLILDNSVQGQTSENVVLTQHQILTNNNSTQTQTSDNVILGAHYSITVNNSTQTQTSDNVILSAHYSIVVNNSTQTQTSDNIILSAHYSIVVNNSTQAQTSDNVILSAHYSITVNNSTQAQISDNIILIQHQVLSINDSIQPQSSENISLFAHYNITVNSTTQTQTSDNISLIQHQLLSINDSIQAQNSENISLFAHYNITTNNATQLQISDNIALIQHQVLVINDTIQVQTSDNITVTQHQVLVINNTSHIQTSENIALFTHYTITINNATQLQVCDNIILTAHYTISINNATQLQNSDNILLTQHYNLIINNINQLQTANNIILTQHYILSISDSIQVLVSDNILWGFLNIQDSTQTQTSQNIILTATLPPPPLYISKVGSFAVDITKTVGQTQSITGLGFQPKMVFFWWGGSGSSADYVSAGNAALGTGAASSDSARWRNSTFIADDANTSSSYKSHSLTTCIAVYGAYNSIDGEFDFTSMDIDGFTLDVTNQFSKTYQISYLALGGTELTNVWVNSFSTTATTGSFAITGLGFKPDAMIFSTVNQTAATPGAFPGALSLGFASGSSNQGVVSMGDVSAVGTTNAGSYAYWGEIYATTATSTIVSRGSLLSFNNDGFTINQVETTDARLVFAIALKGGIYSASSINTRTNTDDIVTTTGFRPTVTLFASANIPMSTRDTRVDNARMSIGAATSIDNRTVQAISDEDNLPVSEVALANYDSAVYLNILDDAITGIMDLKSVESNGFTTIMDDPDPTARWVLYLSMGESLIKNASQAQTADNITITYNPLTLAVDNCTHIQTAEKIFIYTDIYIILARDSIHLQIADNATPMITDIVILKMKDCVQLQTAENILFSLLKATIFAYRKISFGIGKNGPGI